MKRILLTLVVPAFVAVAALGGLVVTGSLPTAAAAKSSGPTLEGRAVLLADTFWGAPASGTQLGTTPINGRTPPFPAQPVQGFSAVIKVSSSSGDDESHRQEELWAMPDNGFGNKVNSPDFLLRVYRVRPDFETARGGSGAIGVLGFVQFRDPDHQVPWPITNEGTQDRVLTGADFDPESLRQDNQGDFWMGDEFGPFLLHFDDDGRLLEPPIPLPGVKSPDNPTLGAEAPTLPRSRGFEGTAISPNSKTLYPALEGALIADPDQQRRVIHEFDIASRSYTGKTWHYRVESADHFLSDLTAVDRHRLLAMERDRFQGAAAQFKRVYLVDLRKTDDQGFLVKNLVLDVTSIGDPDLISLPRQPGDVGLGDPFSFPFETMESVLPLDGRRLLIANDNNYPFSTGRNPDQPDNNEMIIVRVDNLLGGSGNKND